MNTEPVGITRVAAPKPINLFQRTNRKVYKFLNSGIPWFGSIDNSWKWGYFLIPVIGQAGFLVWAFMHILICIIIIPIMLWDWTENVRSKLFKLLVGEGPDDEY